MHRLSPLALLGLLCLPCPTPAASPKRDWDPVQLIGRASDYRHIREYRSYYWAEDFTFLLREEKTGKTWRIISREPTPNYEWRMGPTYTGLKVDWKARPRVKVVGVKAIDRIPEKFPGLKLDEPLLATALIVFVETKPKTWQEFYINNWFHRWGPRADKFIYKYYADRDKRYNLFGYASAQAAPFNKKSQAIYDRNKAIATTFQGRTHATKGNPFGYEIELIDLIGKDRATGGSKVLYGDGKTIPLLDHRKPR